MFLVVNRQEPVLDGSCLSTRCRSAERRNKCSVSCHRHRNRHRNRNRNSCLLILLLLGMLSSVATTATVTVSYSCQHSAARSVGAGIDSCLLISDLLLMELDKQRHFHLV